MARRSARAGWISVLAAHVHAKPIALLRIDAPDWARLRASPRGTAEFTTAVRHGAVAALRAPTMCLLLAEEDGRPLVWAGVIGNPSAITTLQSRVKVRRAFPIAPSSPAELMALVGDAVDASSFETGPSERERLTTLSRSSSETLVHGLAALEPNEVALRSISATLSAPRRVRGNAALQDQCLRTALRAFGLAPGAPAESVQLLGEDETAISRVPTEEDQRPEGGEGDGLEMVQARARTPAIEDGFVEHDARRVPGMDLVGSDATGRAVFSRGDERLEVITANRRPLEHALGVDLVYVNTVRHNVVMVQYKMLERSGQTWTYRPDAQLNDEIDRMEAFARPGRPAAGEYRLHPGVFYMKFVKRDAAISRGGILLPLDHFQLISASPAGRGPRGGLRIDYDALDGRYMREQPFVDLVRAGYIGAYADDAAQLRILIEAVLSGGGAVVAAIQSTVGRTRAGVDRDP